MCEKCVELRQVTPRIWIWSFKPIRAKHIKPALAPLPLCKQNIRSKCNSLHKRALFPDISCIMMGSYFENNGTRSSLTTIGYSRHCGLQCSSGKTVRQGNEPITSQLRSNASQGEYTARISSRRRGPIFFVASPRLTTFVITSLSSCPHHNESSTHSTGPVTCPTTESEQDVEVIGLMSVYTTTASWISSPQQRPGVYTSLYLLPYHATKQLSNFLLAHHSVHKRPLPLQLLRAPAAQTATVSQQD